MVDITCSLTCVANEAQPLPPVIAPPCFVCAGGDGFPSALNTGTNGILINVPADATFGDGWAWNGDDLLVVLQSGATVENLYSTGTFFASGKNGIIVRNCHANPGQVPTGFFFDNCVDVIVEDCTATTSGTGIGHTGIRFDNGSGHEIRRCDISGGENGITESSLAALIEDNYIHDMVAYDPGPDPHIDGIQLFGGNLCDGTTIEHNTVLMAADSNAAITVGSNAGITLHNNKLFGAGATIYIYLDDTNAVTDNRIGDPTVYYITDNSGPGNPTVTGNTDYFSGDPVTIGSQP